MTPEVHNEQIINVPPDQLMGDVNSRFGLKPGRVAALKASILEQGGIQVPLEVSLLDVPVGTALYRITDGHYRQAASLELAQEYEGITCPVVVRDAGTDLERLKRQTAINNEREGLSPMDIARGIKYMLDQDVPRQEIRNIFKRPGGRKGGTAEATVQPLSNSMLNIYVSFLDFPLEIQEKIHLGIIGVGGAYTLAKKPREKWAAIVVELEKEREAALSREDKDEEAFLAQAKKDEEADAKRRQLETELGLAKNKQIEALALADAKIKAESEALTNLRRGAADAATKKLMEEASSAAKADSVAAVQLAEAAKKETDKFQAKLETAQKAATARAEKLAAARAAALTNPQVADPTPPKPIGAGAVNAAADRVQGQYTKLKGPEIFTAFHDFALPSSYPKFRQVALLLERMILGELTPNQAMAECVKITDKGVKEVPTAGIVPDATLAAAQPAPSVAAPPAPVQVPPAPAVTQAPAAPVAPAKPSPRKRK